MLPFAVALLCGLCLTTSASTLPDLDIPEPISAADAAAIALRNNPQLRADLAAIGFAEADLRDARLFLRNPRLDLLVPIGAKPFELIFNFPIEVFVQRPRRIALSQAALDQLAKSLLQNGLNAARDARLAHADLVLAEERRKWSLQASQLRDRIAQLTQARLRVGDIGELDTIAARADAGAAREQLTRAEHDVTLARQRLRFALGLPMAGPEPLTPAAAPPALAPPGELPRLLETAMSARPDLRAAELAIGTATLRAKWEKTRFYWLSAQLAAKEVSPNGVLGGPGLSAEIPIFNRNQGLIARATAEIESASRQYLALKQRAAFEVADALRQMLQAQDALRRLREDVLPPLARGAALAEDQYRKGDVSYLFVLEQTRGLLDANARILDAEAAIRRAEAQLERSTGSR